MLQPGTLLDNKFAVQAAVGRGGFGYVYLADEVLLGQQVAIKELIPALVGDDASLRRFLAEAKATMRLTHENIVRTYNVFSDGGNYYIVMEWMAGGSLEACLQQRRESAVAPMPVDQALRMAVDVCDGLAYAHAHGVVHCDLKPANILFAGDQPGQILGTAKVADFGIAHVSEQMLTRSWLTPAGFVAGTLPYMSPEQTEGVRDDPRIDVYALGAVLYRALTGRTYLDFDQRDTPRAQADNVYRIHNQKPSSPHAVSEEVPSWLSDVLLTALAKRADERYPTATAFKSALMPRGLALGGTAAAYTVEVPRPSVPPVPSEGHKEEARAGGTPVPAADRGQGEAPRRFEPAVSPFVQVVRPVTPPPVTPPAAEPAAGPPSPGPGAPTPGGAPPSPREGAAMPGAGALPAAAEAISPAPGPVTPGGAAGAAGFAADESLPSMRVPPPPPRARPASTPVREQAPSTPPQAQAAPPAEEAQAAPSWPMDSPAPLPWLAGVAPSPAAAARRPAADAQPAARAWQPAAAGAPPAEEPLPSWFWPAVMAAIVLAVLLIAALGALFGKDGRATPEAVVVLVSATPAVVEVDRSWTAVPLRTRLAATDTPRPTASRTPRPTATATETPPPTDTATPETPTAEPVPGSALVGRIVYAAEPSGGGYQDTEIYTAGADGGNIVRLMDNLTTDDQPDWSPSGNRIAFVSIPNGKGEIYAMNPDGKQQARLTNNLYWDESPSWSPDGKQIAFDSDRPQPGRSYQYRASDIYVMNADGGNARLVVDTGAGDMDPDWSPDGRRLVFASWKSDSEENRDLWIVNVDGSGLTHLVSRPARDDQPAWSPDGRRIAFASDEGGGRNIWLVNPDGSGLTQITFSSDGAYSPAWSPDGRYIVYVHAKHIYVISAEGGEARRIIDHEAYDFDPSWVR